MYPIKFYGYTEMTTRKRRLQVTIEPELEPVLARLSKCMGKPQSTIITDLLMESFPVLEQTANALELAAQGKLDLSSLNDVVNAKIQEVNELQESFRDKSKGQ